MFLSSVERKFRFLMKTFQDFSPYNELQWEPDGSMIRPLFIVNISTSITDALENSWLGSVQSLLCKVLPITTVKPPLTLSLCLWSLWDAVFKRSEWTESSVCILFNRRSTAQHFDNSVIFVFERRWRPQKVKPMDLTVQTFRGPQVIPHNSTSLLCSNTNTPQSPSK